MSEMKQPYLRGRGFDVYKIEKEEEILLQGGFKVNCGFPSPAADFEVGTIDLNKIMIRDKNTTFHGFAHGDSMMNVGIFPDALFIIDRAINVEENMIAICFLNGEAVCKKIIKIDGALHLKPENDNYKPIKLEEGDELLVWGVVTWSCSNMLPKYLRKNVRFS